MLTESRNKVYLIGPAAVIAAFLCAGAGAQIGAQAGTPVAATQARQFTVQEAVDYALAHYPAVRAALEQYNAARAGVGVMETNYLPRLDGVWQGDRGSRESVLGVLLPQSPNILTGTQGSVTPHSNRPFWTSGAGLLLSWEPFDFGYRHAQVGSAQATANRMQAQVELTRLGVATAVAEASLAVLADEQRVNASLADVSRREVFDKSVHALVDAHLRPGADASRADAELAASRTRLIEAQQNSEVGSIALAQVLGLAGTTVQITPGPFLTVPPEQTWTQANLAEHPAAVLQQRQIDEVNARITALNHSYYPHFMTESLISARGSGEESNGDVKPGLNGLGFDVYNWEAGLTVQLDLTSIFAIHERKRVEVANRRQQEALYAQTMQALTSQQQTALAQLDGARRVAQNTPVELTASQQSESQAVARFHAGLGTIVDVAEAQSLLAQAEMDDSLARLSIWRALAGLAAADGDLTPFLDAARNAAPAPTPAPGHGGN
ncbi:protein CyaE [Edaphobacter acidisoli]|uniref:Protein CyaE n=2 Tax=Edaphobacter acidisoli TaxID=2040573 RepID=A0A916WAD1_9BACT|nr:protein CyaE [Edaphobacter acidisoli]